MQINHPSTAPDYNAGELRSGKLTTKVLAVGRERALNCYRFSLEITGEETWLHPVIATILTRSGCTSKANIPSRRTNGCRA